MFFFSFCKFVKTACFFCSCLILASLFSSTFDLIIPWRFCNYQMGLSTSFFFFFFFLLISLPSLKLVLEMKVVVVLLFVVQLGALHLKLMLVQKML